VVEINAAMGRKRMTEVMNIQRLKEHIRNFAKLKTGNTENLVISQLSNIRPGHKAWGRMDKVDCASLGTASSNTEQARVV
jgi:hypothetical protein